MLGKKNRYSLAHHYCILHLLYKRSVSIDCRSNSQIGFISATLPTMHPMAYANHLAATDTHFPLWARRADTTA